VADDLKTLLQNLKPILFSKYRFPEDPIKGWENPEFFKAWHQYYMSEKRKYADCDEKSSLDYIGGTIQPVATSHPKKIINASANAKLFSDNDNQNFTFRGRFEDSVQAVAIGYESSQKAHQFLRYLISERGDPCGEQVILSFTIGTIQNVLPPPLHDTRSICDYFEQNTIQTDSDRQIALRAATGFDYAAALKNALAGFKYSSTLNQHIKTVVFALDAAIPGRLAVTFYRELNRDEYLERIAEWHEDCQWEQYFWSDETQKYISFICAP
jgi:CRISPR-associated protein Csd1